MTFQLSTRLISRHLLCMLFLVSLASCIVFDDGYYDLDGWLQKILEKDDRLICSISYESDYFAIVRDEFGIRLEQSISVGSVVEGPSGYVRTVSFEDASGRRIGQLGPIKKVNRDTIELGRSIYENRTEYFPIDLLHVDPYAVGVTIKILKGDSAQGVRMGTVLDDQDFDYIVKCDRGKDER